MPVKNAGQTILAAIDSILNQTLSEFEFIIIDDHSTDNSLKIIVTKKDTRIHVIKNIGKGIAHALNTGLSHAQGKYIARMDADDIAHPSRLERQYEFALKNPNIDVVSCLVKHLSSNNYNHEGYAHHVDWINSILTSEDHYAHRFTDAVVAHPTVFFKAELIKKYGNYSAGNLPEDFELWLRWMDHGLRFAKVPALLLDWTDYPDRLSRTNANYKTEHFFKVKAHYFSKWYNRQTVKTEIWIWGYGHKVFKKATYFSDAGLKIEGFIDLKSRPEASRKVVMVERLNPKLHQLYLVLIGDREGKKTISEYFSERNLKLGEDYFFMN